MPQTDDITERLERLIPPEKSADFARRWKITEMSLFGSVLRGDFGPDSDVDILVSFDQGANWSLWDLVAMQDELSIMCGRKVDLVEREGLRNPLRRKYILEGSKVIYAGP